MTENIKNKNLKSSMLALLAGVKKTPWILGKRAFSVVIILIILSVILSVFVFYKYIYLEKISQPMITDSPSTFKKDIYQEILKDWQLRDQQLQNVKVPNAF